VAGGLQRGLEQECSQIAERAPLVDAALHQAVGDRKGKCDRDPLTGTKPNAYGRCLGRLRQHHGNNLTGHSRLAQRASSQRSAAAKIPLQGVPQKGWRLDVETT
jgi:hypothetical protein